MELEEPRVHSPRDLRGLPILTTEGRVRTGCLTCRARKVKCDERLPSCQKCTRLKKICIYRTPGQRRHHTVPVKSNLAHIDCHEDHISLSSRLDIALPRTENEVYPVHEQPSPLQRPFDFDLFEALGDCQEGQTSLSPGFDIALPPTEKADYPVQEQTSPFERPFDFDISEALGTPDNVVLPDVQPDVQPDLQPDIQLDVQLDVQPDEGRLAPVEASGTSNYHRINTSCQGDHLNIVESTSARYEQTSRIIYLTLAMDWLAASEVPTQSSFSYFLDEVDIPFISSFDQLNWKRIKTYVAQLAMQEPSVARAILPVQALYRAQVDRLPMTHAIFVYQAAITCFESISGDEAVDFQIVLVVAFLLCLTKFIGPNEDGSTFSVLDGAFVTRLEAWLLNGPQSPVSLRICAWLQLLNTAAKRGGSSDLLPEPLSTLLYDHIIEVPSLSVLDCDTHPGNALYDIISAPIFTFHLEIQRISNQIANVTHYRRSRITPADQAEVSKILTSLKAKLCSLWETRPVPLRLQPGELREHFGHTISSPLIAFAGVCLAAYFTEVVAIGRIMGDPLFPSPEAKEAMKHISVIVEGDWNASSGDALNPGYLRPLFIYGIESFEKDDTQWAINRLRQIKNPISRSSFFASFLELHGEAQRNQRRRVTMKYFCLQTFGVPLPFM